MTSIESRRGPRWSRITPFQGAHHLEWGYDEAQLGELFCISSDVAVAAARAWEWAGEPPRGQQTERELQPVTMWPSEQLEANRYEIAAIRVGRSWT
jgi:hypothetical protein